ncbi:MAG: hypothetical protein JNL94_09300 [Planctomycetes bacterium]|nr:hypothetical protein [Planctomycetota bacterium]
MTPRAASLVLCLLPFGWACGERSEPRVTALYDGSGSRLPPGILAAVRVDLDRFEYARMLGFDLGEPAVLHLFELDRNVGGGGEAAVLSGPGAAEVEQILFDEGFIRKIDDDGTIVLGGAGDDGSTMQLATGIVAPRPLRRFESDGRIVYSPTIDMKHDLLELDSRALGELGSSPEIAIAFDGARLARTLRARLDEALGPIGEMAAVELGRRTRGRRGMRSPSDLMFSVLRGVRTGFVAYEADRGRLRIDVHPNSELADFLSAVRDVDGEWPMSDDGGMNLVLACDAKRVAELAAEWNGSDEVANDPLAWWDGRVATTFALDRMDFSRTALALRSGFETRIDPQAEISVFGWTIGQGTVFDGWRFAPAPAKSTRWGRLQVEPGTFLHVRDGKIPTENARVVLTGRQRGEGVYEFDWFGLTP